MPDPKPDLMEARRAKERDVLMSRLVWFANLPGLVGGLVLVGFALAVLAVMLILGAL